METAQTGLPFASLLSTPFSLPFPSPFTATMSSSLASPFPWLNRPDDLVHPLAPMMRCQEVFWTLGLRAYQQELEFLKFCQLKSMEVGKCLLTPSTQGAGKTAGCLNDIADDVREQAISRLQRLQQLNEELRDAIWEEI